jgi:hypothetical protein
MWQVMAGKTAKKEWGKLRIRGLQCRQKRHTEYSEGESPLGHADGKGHWRTFLSAE